MSFEERGGEKRVEVRITRENFSSLSGLAPFLDNPFLVMFGPEENEGVSEDEYLEMMEYALGSGASALIRESSVVLVFRVEGRIVSQKGGVASGETVTFSIPLIDLLLLAEPLEYSIVYR